MLGLDYGDDSDDSDDSDAEIGADTVTLPPALSLPALAQQVPDSEEEDDDDCVGGNAGVKTETGKTEQVQGEEEEGSSAQLLPSIDDALGAASVPDFLHSEAVGPSYGSIFDEPQAVASDSAVTEPPPAAEARGGGSAGAVRPERSSETTRQKNSRKEKLGQATFTLKWDRDCGAEKASGGLESSSSLQSRTMPGTMQRGHRQPARGDPDATSVKVRESGHREAASMKDRTKIKRQRDQSASFLGGRWKSEQEMHMRDFFDS